MNPVSNPFAPGAGNQPPELAGRATILKDASTAIQRAKLGKHSRSQMLLGLRGVGKTVLLNKIIDIAEEHGFLTSFIEAQEGYSLTKSLTQKINQILQKLSLVEGAKEKCYSGLRALKSFASTFKISYGELAISVNSEAGVADSGELESDLSELFVRIGEAAQSAGKGWVLLIDEVQYLNAHDLGALIAALHKVNQKQLPVIFFGAGLPQVAALSGNAKSYAERLFHYPSVGPLTKEDSNTAVNQPIVDEGMEISVEALEEIYQKTKGYPYFLQEWGYHCWQVCETERIDLTDAKAAEHIATRVLDAGFFKVRFDRLTIKQREYVIAMASLGKGPYYRSSDIADILGVTPESLSPRRAEIIGKGMVYSPSHGDIAFTVPLFDEYLTRNYPVTK